MRRVAARVTLGDPLERALRELDEDFGDDAAALRARMTLGAGLGVDLVRLLESHAASIDRRREAGLRADAAVAGARLSGRMVAALPLFCLPLLPAARAPLFDPTGLCLLALGLVLVLVGIRWMDHLVPRPATADDPAALLAEFVGAALDAGAPLAALLEALAPEDYGSLHEPLLRSRRLVRLGLTWPESLRRSRDPVLSEVGALLHRAHVLGQPAAPSLGAFAHRRRTESARVLEMALRRAPVLMVVPLATCVLPAFVLLGLGPFVRGLRLAG
jgi:tight adherence protein B